MSSINIHMYNKNDFAKLGHVYSGMLNDMKRKLVAEGKTGEIGEAPLIKGGPQETAGYVPSKLDRKKMSKKELDDNLYNIKGLSQPDNLEEDEETLKPKTKKKVTKKVVKGKPIKKGEESGKMVKESINNFMRSKSIFDKLYENVTGQFGGTSSMGPEMDEADELPALGIDPEGSEDDMGGEGDEVTITLDRATAEKLLDIIGAAMGDDMGEEGDFDMGDDMGDDMDGGEDFDTDEDEEEMGHAVASPKQPDMGKNNKVGNLKAQSGGASSAYTNKVGADGDYGHALVNAKQPNMGKTNKVGSLKPGKSAFEQ